ncbi:hypothetical protein GCM10010387_22270 [Streptomyces inusitatus]|uniref:Uncharacterized protein n=1 Tax=Streptomyces inusitatus TaxID=68221 RepID=A0A918UQK0_9ACTN|nr:hypothetical protein [Streptomyces inusitatus]GGZ28368.1 hypothetical protein GCM10010387_22270 [Streptomyces inusitatus]
MWSTLIAVIGTLAGVALASATQVWTERRTARREQRQQVAAATAQLLDAVIGYRELFWLRIAALRAGEPEEREERAAFYRARSEITRARDRLALATADPALIDASEAAAWSAIELSDIQLGTLVDGRFANAVEAALDAGRERSRDAHTALRRAATEHVRRG